MMTEAMNRLKELMDRQKMFEYPVPTIEARDARELLDGARRPHFAFAEGEHTWLIVSARQDRP